MHGLFVTEAFFFFFDVLNVEVCCFCMCLWLEEIVHGNSFIVFFRRKSMAFHWIIGLYYNINLFISGIPKDCLLRLHRRKQLLILHVFK